MRFHWTEIAYVFTSGRATVNVPRTEPVNIAIVLVAFALTVTAAPYWESGSRGVPLCVSQAGSTALLDWRARNLATPGHALTRPLLLARV